MIESPIALVGTRYMKDDDFSDPIRIVAKKKIVVPSPIAPTDIIKKCSQNVRSCWRTSINELQGAKINENKNASI